MPDKPIRRELIDTSAEAWQGFTEMCATLVNYRMQRILSDPQLGTYRHILLRAEDIQFICRMDGVCFSGPDQAVEFVADTVRDTLIEKNLRLSKHWDRELSTWYLLVSPRDRHDKYKFFLV